MALDGRPAALLVSFLFLFLFISIYSFVSFGGFYSEKVNYSNRISTLLVLSPPLFYGFF